jgi:hypothetical protein
MGFTEKNQLFVLTATWSAHVKTMCKEDADFYKIGAVVHIFTSSLLRVFSSLALQLNFKHVRPLQWYYTHFRREDS